VHRPPEKEDDMSGMTHDERDAAITRAIGVAPGETVRIEMPAEIVAEHPGAADPYAPCGYCRRCAVHDDPGGCTTVEQFAARVAELVEWGCTEYEARIRAAGERA
jgi:hypothetical protein